MTFFFNIFPPNYIFHIYYKYKKFILENQEFYNIQEKKVNKEKHT